MSISAATMASAIHSGISPSTSSASCACPGRPDSGRRPLLAVRVVRRELHGEPQRRHRQVGVVVGLAPRVGGDRAAGAGLLVVPRVDVVLDQVVAGRVVAVRAAALLVDERVGDGVRSDVGDVAEREGEELLETLLAFFACRHAGARPARPAPGRSPRYGGSGSCRSRGTSSLPGSPLRRTVFILLPDVGVRRELLFAERLDDVEELLQAALNSLSTPPVRSSASSPTALDDRADRLVPAVDEACPRSSRA